MMIIGGLFVLAGLTIVIRRLHQSRNYRMSADGKIVGFRESLQSAGSDQSPRTVYTPIVKYHAEGKDYEREADIGSGKKSYQVGDSVRISYKDNEPDKFIIPEQNKTTYIIGSVAIFVGIAVILLVIFVPEIRASLESSHS